MSRLEKVQHSQMPPVGTHTQKGKDFLNIKFTAHNKIFK